MSYPVCNVLRGSHIQQIGLIGLCFTKIYIGQSDQVYYYIRLNLSQQIDRFLWAANVSLVLRTVASAMRIHFIVRRNKAIAQRAAQ